MKKLALTLPLLGLIAFLTTSCKHSSKDSDLNEMNTSSTGESNNDSVKEIIIDRHGDKMEVITNKSKNQISIRVDGNLYEFFKNEASNDYSTADNKFQYSEAKNEVTLLKKGANMVLFHGKREQIPTKLASQK